jgi:hypothetical protein
MSVINASQARYRKSGRLRGANGLDTTLVIEAQKGIVDSPLLNVERRIDECARQRNIQAPL